MREILIAHPYPNSNLLPIRRASLEAGFHREQNYFSHHQINPNRYPKVCDLSSGDGAIALFLIQKGWKPQDITCIDKYTSTTPLADGVIWEYIDLQALADTLIYGGKLPDEVEKMRESFNLVTHAYSHLLYPYEATVNRFFVQPGGHIYGC